MNILIVEDSEDARVLLEDQLRVHGYDVESAVNGVEALAKARASAPDLIVSDILMPEMDGFELCRQVKRDPLLRGLPFIFYTATYTGSEDKRFALSLGASRFIVKPEDPVKFVAIIEEVLAKHEKHALNVPAKPDKSDRVIEHMHAERLSKKLDKKLQELQTQKEYMQLITDAMPVLISHIDQDYRYQYANKTYEDWFHISRGEINGKHVRDIVGEQGFEIVRPYMDRALRGEAVTFETSLTVYDGSRRYILAKYIPHNDKESGCSGFFELASDISERKQAEQELQLHRERLEELVASRTAQLNVSNQEMETFIYTVSHDLRSPLRSVSGFCHMLMDDYAESLDAQAMDYMQRIRDGVHRMDALIDDLLNLSRVSRVELKQETVNLSAIAEEVVESLKHGYAGRNVEYKIEDNLVVKGDSGLLRVVLENLLDNAWKFTAQTAGAKVEFGCTEAGAGVVYYVRDNGAGFNMDHTNKLFGAFQRLHESDEFPGTGIGLASVQRIIQRHGGKVWAQAEVDKGATFYFTIETPEKLRADG
ncbi:MAG: response regulator [Gammaproteobacteria bacterium]|nr:response regulator [Gammaproteobacteria bacterium]